MTTFGETGKDFFLSRGLMLSLNTLVLLTIVFALFRQFLQQWRESSGLSSLILMLYAFKNSKDAGV